MPNIKYPIKDREKKHWYCEYCGKEITKGQVRCIECANKMKRYVERPNKEELKQLIRTLPFTKIGEMFGVSDNAIRKWCKLYNLPFRVKDIKNYSNEEWNNI